MKTKIFTISFLISLLSFSGITSQTFNKKTDLLLANFDLKPDEDDVMAAAGLAERVRGCAGAAAPLAALHTRPTCGTCASSASICEKSGFSVIFRLISGVIPHFTSRLGSALLSLCQSATSCADTDRCSLFANTKDGISVR